MTWLGPPCLLHGKHCFGFSQRSPPTIMSAVSPRSESSMASLDPGSSPSPVIGRNPASCAGWRLQNAVRTSLEASTSVLIRRCGSNGWDRLGSSEQASNSPGPLHRHLVLLRARVVILPPYNQTLTDLHREVVSFSKSGVTNPLSYNTINIP